MVSLNDQRLYELLKELNETQIEAVRSELTAAQEHLERKIDELSQKVDELADKTDSLHSSLATVQTEMRQQAADFSSIKARAILGWSTLTAVSTFLVGWAWQSRTVIWKWLKGSP